ncbi:phosphatidylglycerol:prolipoprotein diacylglycerol transferase [Sagittula marina]|uniref:Phosphatidylglycerol--prolipoprotein diacylglyceryl transferase n=1 Tax=Sagittula marina TaxID=943940 RepID=A0A7W6DQG6_9RHOB|nr:prolipoprotein diacylglyceryl transferase [Sagittula marina]MBB3984133.1 phosphatidylglycerol:prolipoprotein diacylglycerol transferase [Sagittula marina]
MIAAIPFPDLSSELFSIEIFGMTFALRWYALAYIAGILIGWRIAVTAVKRAQLWPGNHPPATPTQIEDLLTWIILGVILGGRFGYVFFYNAPYYLAHPLEIPMIWQGGMAFHGGLLGVVIATWIWCLRNRAPILSTADLLAMATPPGLLLGRLANFVNAELWGRPTDLPWGVIFPGAAAQNCGQAAGELCARHPSQLYEAGLEGLLLGLLLLVLAWRGALKRPGVIAATFFIGYACARIFVEFFRQPDAQFTSDTDAVGYALQFGGAGVTQGQLLSFAMIVAGLVFILRSRRT